MAHRLFAISALGLVRSQQEKALLAEPALAAADGEGDDNAIADLEVFDFGAQLNHLAHVFVAENIAALHGWLVAVEQMKV